MMKKHNEGYALPFVLVVMVVLTMVAVSILSFSLRNLQSQQASIDRMKAQYEAAGEIEKVVAVLDNDQDITLDELLSSSEITLEDDEISYDENSPKRLTVKFSCTKNSVKIICSLEIVCQEDIRRVQDNGTAIYFFVSPEYKYLSSEISTVDSTPDENGGNAG